MSTNMGTIAPTTQLTECPACSAAGEPRMHVMPENDGIVVCSACGEAGTLEMSDELRAYHCDTCGEPRLWGDDGGDESDEVQQRVERGECYKCGEELGGHYECAVDPEQYRCYECGAEFAERTVNGIEYQCPVRYGTNASKPTAPGRSAG